MRYITWLFDQLDTSSSSARFAKVVWDDVNNGCATARYSTSQLLAHFEEKHYENYQKLSKMLTDSYVDFLRDRATRGYKNAI